MNVFQIIGLIYAAVFAVWSIMGIADDFSNRRRANAGAGVVIATFLLTGSLFYLLNVDSPRWLQVWRYSLPAVVLMEVALLSAEFFQLKVGKDRLIALAISVLLVIPAVWLNAAFALKSY